MLLIPFELPPDAHRRSGRGPVVIVMVLEPANIARLRAADPLDFQPRVLRQQLHIERPIRDLDFILAYEEDTAQLVEFKVKGDMAGLMRWIERGRKNRPEDGTAPVKLNL